jgi:predicted nucleic acid-binding protein
MKPLAVVDTSFLMALLNEGDRFHSSARSESEKARDYLIPNEAWSETLGVVHRRNGFVASVRFRAWLDAQSRVRIGFSGEREHRLAWRLYVEKAGRISFTDALVVAWARLEGADLLTFDAEQGIAAAN